MFRATEILGAHTYDAQGNFVGRVREMFIEPAEQANRVAWLLLARGRYQPLVARYDQVGFVAPGTIRLNVDEQALRAFSPNEAWLAIRKDLLDQQIIDTQGRKVVRVNDLGMSEVRSNGSVELRVTQVDVGLPGAVGRLLHGLAPPQAIRQLQAKLPPRVIPWEFVNLIEADPLRRLKLRITSHLLARLHPADLAEIMEELSASEREAIIASLDEQTAAEVIAELDRRLQTQVVEKLAPQRAADIIEEMAPDEAAHLIAGLSPETSQDVMEELPRDDAREVSELLRFDKGTAGWMMNTDFILAGEDATREEAVNWIHSREANPDQLDTVVLIDAKAQFAGTVSVGRLLLAPAERPLRQLRSELRLSVKPETGAQEVFDLFDKYNLRSLAVVDGDERPIGVITVDDVVSHLRGKA
ncbi:MAG TPA: CBS domain-containing protein [Candidatus Acidoferrales bacterium]|nr:CBS domain-containing protein [Candidatus Acidoferrales bacterium]